MIFTIHRGANEIGGTCIEVCTAKTRIILDIGKPLENNDTASVSSDDKLLPNIPELYKPVKDKDTVIIISHAHQDHYGLIGHVEKSIPVYIGEVSHKLIELSAVFKGEKPVIENPIYIKTYEPFVFGDIEITPYLMDHTCCDAYAFLLCGEGQSFFYSGDFRGHGRKWKWFRKFLHNAPKNVDYMFLEGTSLSRQKQKFKTEEQLETQFIKTFWETKGLNLVLVSGQNIDRLVTIYRACKQSVKTFVVDFYIAQVLFELAGLGYKVPNPCIDGYNIRVFYPNLLTRKMLKLKRNDLLERFAKNKINFDEINKNTGNIVMSIRTSMMHEIKLINNLSGSTLIYSMWEGYKETTSTIRFLSQIEKRGATIKSIHTSGHADHDALQKMIDAVQPKTLVPIHTTEADKYKEFFPNANVRCVENYE